MQIIDFFIYCSLVTFPESSYTSISECISGNYDIISFLELAMARWMMTGINLWQFGLKDPLFHHPWQNMWRNWIILMMNDLSYLYQICILMIGMLIQGWCENIQEYSMHKLNEFDDKEGMSSRVYFKVRHWDIVSHKNLNWDRLTSATYMLTLYK